MITRLFSYLSGARIDWAVCGGHAIDLFVGRKTRDHKDIDVAVFWDQRDRLLEYLLQDDWRLFEPENGLLREVTNFENDFWRNDNLWCISSRSTAYQIEKEQGNFYRISSLRKQQDTLDFIEFLFNKRNGNSFIYKRDSGITHDGAILRDGKGILYLAPELVLLYKSVFIRYIGSNLPSDMETVSNYRHDFEVVLPLLNPRQKHWLESAMQTAYPQGHEWLDALQSSLC